MDPYHKIQTVFNRDPDNNYKTLIEGEFALPEFEYLAENQWVFTEKVDGTNIRVMIEGGDVLFGGRTDRAQIPAHLTNALNSLFLTTKHRAAIAEIFDGQACLYGEGYGPKIQGGGKYREDPSFVLFDVNIGGWWLQREDVEDIAEKLGIDVVPILGEGTLYDMVEMTRKGFQSQWGDFRAEGIVARPATEMCTRGGDRVITKIKCKDFR